MNCRKATTQAIWPATCQPAETSCSWITTPSGGSSDKCNAGAIGATTATCGSDELKICCSDCLPFRCRLLLQCASARGIVDQCRTSAVSVRRTRGPKNSSSRQGCSHCRRTYVGRQVFCAGRSQWS